MRCNGKALGQSGQPSVPGPLGVVTKVPCVGCGRDMRVRHTHIVEQMEYLKLETEEVWEGQRLYVYVSITSQNFP